MQAILAGTCEAFALVVVLRIGLLQKRNSTCCEGTVEVWRLIVSVSGITSWVTQHIGEVDEFREVCFRGQEDFVRVCSFYLTLKTL